MIQFYNGGRYLVNGDSLTGYGKRFILKSQNKPLIKALKSRKIKKLVKVVSEAECLLMYVDRRSDSRHPFKGFALFCDNCDGLSMLFKAEYQGKTPSLKNIIKKIRSRQRGKEIE